MVSKVKVRFMVGVCFVSKVFTLLQIAVVLWRESWVEIVLLFFST